ncbi:MAG: SNF2-related protein [Bacillus sp. (in: Bacteria)]|nr:SNF2-related protein [Bacillus sp. (in: firmicutes)]
MISANREVLGYVVVGKDSGLLLSNKKRDRKTSDMDVIVFKHHLFWHDSESFYGLSYEIRSLTFKDHNKTVQLEGIWIPLPELFTLLSQVGNWKKDSRVRVDETLLSFHQELQGIHTALLEKAFIPGQKGNWELDMGHNLMNMERLPPILHEKPHFFELCGSKEEGKQLLIDYFSRFLQFAVIKTSNKWTQPYFQALQIQKDRQYQHWIKALQTPANQFHLSEHLYPYALMSWNGKTEKPFQFQLIIQEGQGKDGLWTLKLYVKEWNTGNMYSIEGIYKGQHPFLMNPIPFIKEQWERVNKLFPFTMMEIETGECKLTLEETTHFLFHQVHYIENLGVPVLIPEQIREVYGKPKISGTIHPAEQEDYSGYRTSKISWSFLVNGMVVDDIQFKEWVEGRQEMVYIHNHWVRWDLALAEKLYKEYETSNRESEFYNNWRKAFLWENIPLKEELEMGSPEATEGEIQWSLSEEWNNFKERETTPLPSRWRQLLRPYQLEGVQWLLKMKDHGLGACLADDMGLGKTIQTIAYMDVTIAQTNQKPFLIICPTSLVTNWVEELNKFAPSLSYYVHEGKPSERIKQLKEEYTLSKIIICSYPLAVRDMEVIRGFDWQGLLLDEAQRIKKRTNKNP